jgi:hypothetical protein
MTFVKTVIAENQNPNLNKLSRSRVVPPLGLERQLSKILDLMNRPN